MTAAAGRIVLLLDSVARQLQAGTLNISDCARLADICCAVPQELSFSERQAVTRQVLLCASADGLPAQQQLTQLQQLTQTAHPCASQLPSTPVTCAGRH